jgi:hypothetical protein
MTITFNTAEIEAYTKLLTDIVNEISITETQFSNLVKSYGAVGKYLEDDPRLEGYSPLIFPQGSLRLGTIIQPVGKDDDLDVDLVIRLTGKDPSWTQSDLKRIIGNRLKSHGIYKDMLGDEGRRCWTLLYRHNSDSKTERYHMDILPSVAQSGYERILNEVLSKTYSLEQAKRIALRITDNKSRDYSTSRNILTWHSSNPDAYAYWFADRCRTSRIINEGRSIMAAIMPIGKLAKEKSILQQVIQILKRHRDIMFKNNHEDKPISIIITTLAARAYQGEDNLVIALNNVVTRMPTLISKNSKNEYVVENPVNPEENFADKWPSYPKRQQNFFRWLEAVGNDLNDVLRLKGVQLREKLADIVGSDIASAVSRTLIVEHQNNIRNGIAKVTATGSIGSIGKSLNASNCFFGEE